MTGMPPEAAAEPLETATGRLTLDLPVPATCGLRWRLDLSPGLIEEGRHSVASASRETVGGPYREVVALRAITPGHHAVTCHLERRGIPGSSRERQVYSVFATMAGRPR